MGILSGIRKNVLVLGIVSFLTDVSSEMVFPILPLFLSSVLGAGSGIIGLIEGVADSIAGMFDIFFGYFSDRAGERKKFVIAGYGISSVCKIGFALANSWPIVLFARGIERLGKSIRTSPRDAIIAASTEKSVRGKAFGLHRMMDTLGAIVGPVIAYFLLGWLGNTAEGFRAVFYSALVPAVLAVAVAWLFLREPKAGAKNAGNAKDEPVLKKRQGFWKSLSALPENYRRFVGISCLFSLAYFSFALLILRANDIGIAAQNVLLLYILYNIVYAASSIPIGMLSDRIGRKTVIAASFFFYAAICIGFVLASGFWQAALLFALYGLFVAADESVNKAYVSDMVKEKSRGMALGAYNSAVSVAYLPASAAFGAIWAMFGAGAAFGIAAAVAAIAGAGMLLYAK